MLLKISAQKKDFKLIQHFAYVNYSNFFIVITIMYVRVLILVVCLNVCQCQTQNGNGYGTIELVKHNRRSRLLSDFVDASASAAGRSVPPVQPAAAAQASPMSIPVPRSAATQPNPSATGRNPRIPSTERMLQNYGNIFQMDTKNLTDKQRTLLERIVERVARLGGSLEPENDVKTDEDNQNESRARHRNRNVRKNAAKSSAAVPAPAAVAAAAAANEAKDLDPSALISTTAGSTTTTKTIKRTTAGIIAHPTKPVSSSTTKVGKSKVTQASSFNQLRPNSTEVVLGNITTTSIVDSLSKDNAREDLYNRRPIIAEKANVKVSKNFLQKKKKTK